MITRFGMAPRRRGLTTAAVIEHWRTSHADAAGRIPGLRRYVQLHPVLVDGRPPLPHPLFDACSMLDFDDIESMDAGFASPTFQQDVQADERAFVDKIRFSMVLTEREVVAPLPEEGVVLVTFLRRHPAASVEDFRAVVTGEWRATAGGVGREQALAVEAGRTGREANAADAVDLRGFADAGAAVDWLLAEDGGVDASLALAGYAYGSAHLLAKPFRVV